MFYDHHHILDTDRDYPPLYSFALIYSINKLDLDPYLTDHVLTWDDGSGIKYYDDYYTIPEAIVLQEMRKTFAISDADFEQIKQIGHFWEATHMRIEAISYQDGYFVAESRSPGYGGCGIYKISTIGYTYQDGVLKICLEQLNRDYEETSFWLEFYFEIEYVYTGDGSLTIEDEKIVSTDKSLIDSLRIRSIKTVTDTSIYTLEPISTKS